ncbi:MAG: DNA topoisomerase 3 [Firmicutes bacterium]|nr:DNA topoisomerase 3 [Bacillota bacterium]
MSKRPLIIAEKPSVAKSLANVIGAYQEKNGYLEGRECIVSWCLGHLAEYAFPESYDEKYAEWNFEDLPIIPDPWRLAVTKDKKKQYTVLKELMCRQDIDYVINACDAGREGELIFRRVYQLAKCKLPVMRLWISSMEDEAIREGFRTMKASREYDNLAAASVCRAKADWLLGINESRAFTTTYGRRLILGRVQTPTLAMIVDREAAIEGFQKEQYFLVHLKKDGLDAVSDKFTDRAEAEALAELCRGKDATVRFVDQEQKTIAPPRLYDLTSLQRDANRLFGLTASQTLEAAQALYESKLITYPRTDSKFLTEDMEETAGIVIRSILEAVPFVAISMVPDDIGRLLNNKKVSDHHAIIPTAEIGKCDFDSLSERDRKVLFLIATRLLCAAGKPHKYTVTTAGIECQGKLFGAQSSHTDGASWKSFEEAMKAYCRADAPEDEDKGVETRMPELHEGDVIQSVDTVVTDHWTKPPKHYTEGSLLSAMEHAGSKEMDDDVERKGLGTPATRASMIEKLIAGGYVTRNKKQLLPTDEGKLLISLVPEYLKSASMTAEWENRLLAMERGQDDPNQFIEDIIAQLMYTLQECKAVPEDERSRYSIRQERERESLGNCPICGKPVYEKTKVFRCSDDDCSFCLWKDNNFLRSMRKTMTRDMVVDLLTDGRTFVKGLYSKKRDKSFSADLVLDVQDGKVSYSLEFPKNQGRK